MLAFSTSKMPLDLPRLCCIYDPLMGFYLILDAGTMNANMGCYKRRVENQVTEMGAPWDIAVETAPVI